MMAETVKKTYKVITRGLTVYGKGYGELLELDEGTAQRFVTMRYLAEVIVEPAEPKKKAPAKKKAAPKKKTEETKE